MLESDPIMSERLEQERAAPGSTESHRNAGSRDATPAGQSRIPRTRSEDAPATPGVAVPGVKEIV